MKCPNCGFEFFEGFHCPDCGVDVYVFHKTRSASIRLYNEALKLAEERDLSGAAANLEQSLLFDKNNIQARNLLGLINFHNRLISAQFIFKVKHGTFLRFFHLFNI